MCSCLCLWHVQSKRLHSELCESEDRREEAERKAAQAADQVARLTDVANQMEETRKENESLITQVFHQIDRGSSLNMIRSLVYPCFFSKQIHCLSVIC